MTDIIIIGGGPAGMMASIAAASLEHSVLLVEKNEKLGKKMFITGKGRCNISNACPTEDFFANVVRNPKFLMSALYTFDGEALIHLLEENGLHTKVERGMRVFPASDKSSDAIKCLEKILFKNNVAIKLHTAIISIRKEDGLFLLNTQKGETLTAKSVVIATGGSSYSQTGSTGDGYRFAENLGHRVAAPHPALIPLLEQGNICANLQGLSLKNVRFTLFNNNKEIFSEMGEMLFTHEGISGPLVLSASSYINYTKPVVLTASIDLKPALSFEKLDARILRDFEQYKNKQIKNVMGELLPQRMIETILGSAGIDAEKAVNSITKKEREDLAAALKDMKIKIKGTASLDEAIITRGGVDTRDVSPSTMQSKCMEGLFFAGEVLDVDALTGGFNMQIAFSTGYLAGINAKNIAVDK